MDKLRKVVKFTSEVADRLGSTGFSEILSDGNSHYISQEMETGGKLPFKWIEGEDFVTMRFMGTDYKIEFEG